MTDDPKALAAELQRIHSLMKKHESPITLAEALAIVEAKRAKTSPEPEIVALVAQLHIAESAERGEVIGFAEAVASVTMERRLKPPSTPATATVARPAAPQPPSKAVLDLQWEKESKRIDLLRELGRVPVEFV